MIPLQWIINQLKFLIDIEMQRSFDYSSLKKFKIGWIAVWKLDGFENKELINLLCKISQELKEMLKERGLI